MDIQLTKDAEALICIMYKLYLERRKNSISKFDAKLFNVKTQIHTVIKKMNYDDLCEACRELHRANFVECFYADDEPQDIWFSDKGLIYMENRFINGLTGVLEYISKAKYIIPFL